MITGPIIRSILEAGNAAPSGENCQPWRFLIKGDSIEVHIDPNRDRSPYNWGQRASYMATGAAVENMCIAASVAGYKTKTAYFPSVDSAHVATLTLTRATDKADQLAPAIHTRVTNRKPYATNPLAMEDEVLITDAVHEPGCELRFAKNRHEVTALGLIGAINEEIMLSEKHIHDFFFSHVNWTAQEENRKRMGFYIETLELPPPAKIMFKLLKHWSVARLLTRVAGIHKVVASENGKTNARASAMGALISDGSEPIDFVRAGRALERIWLTATIRGLSIQPLTGVLFFKLCIDGGGTSHFSPANLDRIERAYTEVIRMFNAGKKRVVCMLRIGVGEPPSAHSSRMPIHLDIPIS